MQRPIEINGIQISPIPGESDVWGDAATTLRPLARRLPYMGGRGIQERTKELKRRLFRRMVLAIFAICFGAGTLTTTILLAGQRASMGYSSFWLALATALVLGVCAGLLLPFFIAKTALQIHIERLKDETRRRGAGWAKN
jgi:hypothetical protein